MQFEQVDTAEALSRQVARAVVDAVRARPDLLLCPATGATPARAYGLLAEEARREPALFARLRVVQLDEWGGLPPEHPASCAAWLRRNLLDPLGVAPERMIGWEGVEEDPEGGCAALSRRLAEEGPIDLCLLGLGLNGHLGFLEPAEWLPLKAHRAVLSAVTRGHEMVAHLPTPPDYGWTLGLGELMAARRILLMVTGTHKQAVLRRLRRERVSTHLPASFLYLHPEAACLFDAAAAG